MTVLQGHGDARAASDNVVLGSASTNSRRFTWILGVGLITVLLCMPFFRTVSFGDEGVLLNGADRLIRGDRLYLDFFEILPPGGFLITATWFGIAGISIWSARLLLVITIAGIACFTYLASQKASKNAPLSALLAIGWVVMSQGVWTQLSHHWFTTFFAMVAAWAALQGVEHPTRKCAVIAGLFAGAGAMVTPPRGVLVLLAAAIPFADARRSRAQLVSYLAGSMFVPICVILYLGAKGSLIEAINDVILFAAARYPSIQSVPFAWGIHAQNAPLAFVFPIGALLALVKFVKSPRTALNDRIFVCCVGFGVAGFVGLLVRPSIVHIGFAAPLVCPLLSRLVSELTRTWLPELKRAVAIFAVCLCIPSAVTYVLIARGLRENDYVVTPRGGAILISDRYMAPELLAWIEAAPLKDQMFFYPYMPAMPFLTAREHASKYDIFIPGYSLPSQYQEACMSAMRRASWLIIDLVSANPAFIKAIFPGVHDAEPPETLKFESAMQRGFELVTQVGVYQIRRRAKGVDESVCARIAQ